MTAFPATFHALQSCMARVLNRNNPRRVLGGMYVLRHASGGYTTYFFNPGP